MIWQKDFQNKVWQKDYSRNIKLNCKETPGNSLQNSVLLLTIYNLNDYRALFTVSQTKVTMRTKLIWGNPPIKWWTLLFLPLSVRFFSAFVDTSKALGLAKTVKVVVFITMVSTPRRHLPEFYCTSRQRFRFNSTKCSICTQRYQQIFREKTPPRATNHCSFIPLSKLLVEIQLVNLLFGNCR